MAKKVIEVKEIGNCKECIHAVKDRAGEVIGCRNGTNKPCDFQERGF